MVNIAFNFAQLKSIILKNITTYPMICVISVGSSNTSAATVKFNIGLIYKSMPILDELLLGNYPKTIVTSTGPEHVDTEFWDKWLLSVYAREFSLNV